MSSCEVFTVCRNGARPLCPGPTISKRYTKPKDATYANDPSVAEATFTWCCPVQVYEP